MPISESQLRQVVLSLSEAAPAARRRTSAEMDLPSAVAELAEWLGDEHQAANAYAQHWVSLLDDVMWAADQWGPILTAAVFVDRPRTLEELRACRDVLKGAKRPPDASLRRRIERANDYLAARLREAEVLVAALRDLLNADDEGQARIRATVLVALIGEAGHDPQRFPQRLRSVLSDEALTIATERGESLPEDPRARAGMSIEARIALGEELLSQPARRGDVVVWLRLLNANLGWPPVLELGPRVWLFDDRWFPSVLKEDPARLPVDLPEAVDELESLSFRSFVGDERDADDDARLVFVRVVVADSTQREAVITARRTADALAGLASLHGTPPRLWELDDSFASFTRDGVGSGALFSAPPTTQLSLEDLMALRSDHTAQTLADMADRLALVLPVRDPAIRHAAFLLSWLRGARVAAGPARLLLCDRVVEQVSGWAGFGEPRRFASEFLRVSWTSGRVRGEVSSSAFVAADDLRRIGRGDIADRFSERSAGDRLTIDLRRFLGMLEDMVDTLESASAGSQLLRDLAPLVATPYAAASWIQRLGQDFDRREARRRRTRNALVHGGPIAERTVETTVEFADSLAVRALATSIEGRLDGRDLVDHFLEERGHLEAIERRLRAGEPLSDALFWDDGRS